MTLMEFFGCTFIAFGPPFALFVFTIARDPLRIIVLIASSFSWLCALLISSLVWFAVPPLRDQLAFGLVFSVIIQEAFRFLFYKILRRANDGLLALSQQTDQSVAQKDFSNRHIMAYVSGLGFGLIAGAFSLVNVLADMSGPGTMGIEDDSKYFFIVSAFMTLFMILLHMTWGVIFFAALDNKNWLRAGLVVGAHMFVSTMSLFNQGSSGSSSAIYLATLLPMIGVLGLSGAAAFNVAGGSFVKLREAFVCRKGRYDID